MPPWFDAEVDALERRTRPLRDRDNSVLFYGSSTFTLWHDIEAHFPAYAVVNHGFGGATLADCVEYFERLVPPMRPRAVILYAGDNDLDNGASPDAVLGCLDAFVARMRTRLPGVPLAFVSIKISRARLHLMHTIAYANRLAERRLAAAPDADFLDLTRPMTARGYETWSRYFSDDPLHMNRAGYRVLAKAITAHLAALEARIGRLRVRDDGPPPAWAREDDSG
jgi:lysophospholipase L1-like esterase